MILAAGRGERMRPLTDHMPKPLLTVHGKPLIVWHLEALARAGVREVVINTAWQEALIVDALGDGGRWGLRICYSMEGRDHGGALETAGGIACALPLLRGDDDDNAPFWLVSADIHAPGFRFDAESAGAARFLREPRLQAHVWLVPNPPFHVNGDFGIDADGLADADASGSHRLTYANLALCRPSLVDAVEAGTRAALGPRLFARAREGRVGAECFGGAWENIGTPAQLEALNARPLD